MAELKPEIDETIYFLKVKLLEVDTMICQIKAGMNTTLDIMQERNNEAYEALNNLHKLLKAE